LWQPRRGYRYGVEVYALGAFALARKPGSVVDLGAGSGVVGMLLAWRGVRVTSVERDPRWVELALRSVADSGLSLPIVQADVREWAAGERFDLAVANPPWFPAAGPLPPDPWRAASRAALHGDVRDFVTAGLRAAPAVCLVGPTGCERHLDGWWIRRRACLGRKVVLVEVAAGAGPTRDVELGDVYAPFRTASDGSRSP
jgi:SAM-dependent methyltransferase